MALHSLIWIVVMLGKGQSTLSRSEALEYWWRCWWGEMYICWRWCWYRWYINMLMLMLTRWYMYICADTDAYEAEGLHKKYMYLLISQPFLNLIVVLSHHEDVWEKYEIVFDISLNKLTFPGNAWDHLQNDGHFAQKTRSMTSSQELWYIFIYSQNKQNLNKWIWKINIWCPVTINCKCCNEEWWSITVIHDTGNYLTVVVDRCSNLLGIGTSLISPLPFFVKRTKTKQNKGNVFLPTN